MIELRPMKIVCVGERAWHPGPADKLRRRLGCVPAESTIITTNYRGFDTWVADWLPSTLPHLNLVQLEQVWSHQMSCIEHNHELIEHDPDLVIAYHRAIGESARISNLLQFALHSSIPYELHSTTGYHSWTPGEAIPELFVNRFKWQHLVGDVRCGTERHDSEYAMDAGSSPKVSAAALPR